MVTGWSAVLLLDGEPMTDPIPVDPWDVGTIAAPLVATITGGTVSIAQAVHASRHLPDHWCDSSARYRGGTVPCVLRRGHDGRCQPSDMPDVPAADELTLFDEVA